MTSNVFGDKNESHSTNLLNFFTLTNINTSTYPNIAGVKTPRIGVFFISLKSYENVNVENELAWAIWTFAAQVMCKRRARSQTDNLTPNH
jgi:hypothetical protein